MNVDVAIIGGGVSGLATAFDLKRRGHGVVVLERQAHAGGNAISERIGGFLMEHGPSTVNAGSEAANAYSSDLWLDSERCDLGEGVKHRYLTQGDGLSAISINPLGFLLSDYLSLPARLRLMVEFALPRRGDGDGGEESVADFCSRRFGREFTRRVIDPLVGGLHAGRAHELSMSAVFPALQKLERDHRSITLSVLHRRRHGGRIPSRRLFSWAGGIGALPRTLAARLGDTVRTGVTVRRIQALRNGFRIDVGDGGVIRSRAFVIATQPHVASQLLETVDAPAAEAACGIGAPPLAVVFLGYRRNQVAHPLDGLGYLSAAEEGRHLNGAQFCSTMFPGRAPEGHVAIAGYIGGARAPELARLPSDALVDMARSEFADLLGAKGDPVIARVRHWALGIPQYRLGHGRRIEHIAEASNRVPGLFLTGNYFHGPSVAMCLANSRDTAINVDSYLAASERQAGRETPRRTSAS